MAMVMYKDIADEPGDRAFGKKTPVVRYGAPAVQKAVVALTIMGGATAVVDAGLGLRFVALCLGLCVSLWVLRSGVHGVAIEGHRLATTVAVLLLVSGL